MILMQPSLTSFEELNIDEIVSAPALFPFDDRMMDFLNTVSKTLLSDKEAKLYPDVVTFGFWIRRASTELLKKRFMAGEIDGIILGRGVIFHIAPSNVPVNYAYSLVSGLICGNKNVIRIPSKDFEQVTIINRAFDNALSEYPNMRPYVNLVRYGHDSDKNDILSGIADVRVIWGGDNTIAEVRKSALKPRAYDVTFADRYSLAVIDSDAYMAIENKAKVAQDFYNDTYLTDQNACTSPRAIVWLGKSVADAMEIFWNELHELVLARYDIAGVQAVNKLTSGYLLAVLAGEGVKRVTLGDNLIVRMQVPRLSRDMVELKDNSGYFFECVCDNIMDIRDFCDDNRCQTLSYIGEKSIFTPLLKSGIYGIDRIVPIGKTMDFDLIWDGYNLFERLTRQIVLVEK